MANRPFARKQLPIAITAALLLFAGWVLYRNFFVAAIAAPRTVKMGQRIALHVSFPGWRDERFYIWRRMDGDDEFTAQLAYAERRWDWRYHFEGGFRPGDSAGTCDLFLTHSDEPPGDGDAEATARLTFVP